MDIVKIINNNVVSSVDEAGREVIIMGKGIGFQKKNGDAVEPDKVEKVFRLPDENQEQFARLVEDIPYENVKLANDIINYASEQLHKKLSKSIYITLMDHLNFAIERQKQGIAFHNALLWEIQRYYEKEYQVGKASLDIIEERTGVRLEDDEAGFIALHILNAELDSNITDSMVMPGMIKDILNVVKYTLNIDYDETSLAYERFVTHLKFFVQRAVTKKYYNMDEDAEVFREFIEKCPQEYDCACKVKVYMKKKTDYDVSDEEMLYLTMHIYRLNRRN